MAYFYERKDREQIVKLCKDLWPLEVHEVLHRANLATENTFIFTHRWDMELCETPVTFYDKIDWTYEHKGDFEWTVNLNRSRFMNELGQAYWLTEDEKYAEAFIRLLKDWISQNPLTPDEIQDSQKREYNVKATWRKLDSGIRIANWIRGYTCIRESPLWTQEFDSLFLDAVTLHGRYLRTAFTNHDAQSNWGFLETNGLFQIALCFPQLQASPEWLQVATTRLEKMCRLQVFEDGMHNEQSPMYHHEVLHCLFESVWLAKLNDYELPLSIENSLKRLYTASVNIIKPTGKQPMLSDSDDTDIRDVLTRGACLFKRSELKSQGYNTLDYEGIWYFGSKGAALYEALQSTIPDYTSIYLPQSGYAISRTNWSETAHYTLLDVGHMDVIRAHGHDDLMHLELSLFGEDFLIDTGRYTYMENEDRAYFKEAFQHNTATVDGIGMTPYIDSWTWGRAAQPIAPYFKTTSIYDYVEVSHDGYWKLNDPVHPKRRLLFVKPYYWLLIDEFKSHSTHAYTEHFHFAESLDISVDPSNTCVTASSPSGKGARLLSLTNVVTNKAECSISRHYNQKHPSTKVTFTTTGSGTTCMITIIEPFSHSDVPLQFQKVEAQSTKGTTFLEEEVTALTVSHKGGNDHILVSHEGPNSFLFNEIHATGEVIFAREDKDIHVVKV
ncbi:heparinase [Pontibacillus halophilus JSM 076056 = DSM 19796]|uniref:Heparinase n=1 Tax=Pontibacillus halophilus JSM 076056 = DSM 19796 TaxID=1385510 RepID=A0A0A5GLK6_9BACI|nr:alginate lyase family protein [Pontibacillus halophilus]KGX92010.1 heparinase [Pontibacillus halophilus JSM 076056 = DSM 19796]